MCRGLRQLVTRHNGIIAFALCPSRRGEPDKFLPLGVGTAFHSINAQDEELECLVKFPLITFEKAHGVRDEPSVQAGTLTAAAAVKAVNPEVKVPYYKNVIIDWFSAMSPELETIEGGYLQDTEGNYPVINTNSNRKYFDISQPAVQDWWMKDATRMLSDPHIDGIFIDANIKVWVTKFFAKWNKMGDEKAKQIQEGYHQLMARLNDEHRQDKIILANILRARFENGGLEFIDYLDGSYLEAFEHAVDGASRPDYMAKGIASAQKAAPDTLPNDSATVQGASASAIGLTVDSSLVLERQDSHAKR